MGSIYYVERNGVKYAYESTSRRVPGKKNPVTDKVYLGKVDPETGKIIPKEPRVRPEEEHVLRYGAVTVLDAVQDGLGLLEDLRESFPDIANKVMGAAMAQVIEPTCFDDLHFVVEESIIADALKLRGNLSPTVMSDLSEDLGGRYGAMDCFFRSRLARSASGGPYALDLTSVSTYSDMGGWSEWGHNRDGESLRQTEMILVTDSDGVPVAFRMLPGSIADSAVLRDTVEWMSELGCGSRLVMDRGFENAGNIAALLDMGMDFTMPSNIREEPIRKLLTRAVADLRSSGTFRTHEGNSYKVAEYEVGVADLGSGHAYVTRVPDSHKDSEEVNALFDRSRKISAFVVYDPKKAADDIDRMVSAVERAEMELEGTVRRNPEKEFSKLMPAVRRHLEWSVDDDGVMHLHRKQNSFTFEENRAGMFVMFASPGTSWEVMMTSYDVRDWVEKAFDIYKTDLDGSRSRTGDPDRARGRMFIKFVALIMRVSVQNTLRDHEREILSSKRRKDNVCGLTVDSMMRSLGTLMLIHSPGYDRLTPASKTVREIFALFGLEEPKGGRISR